MIKNNDLTSKLAAGRDILNLFSLYYHLKECKGKKQTMLRKKWPAFRHNFSKGWQLLSFPWSKRHLFQGSSCYKEKPMSAHPSQNIIIYTWQKKQLNFMTICSNHMFGEKYFTIKYSA